MNSYVAATLSLVALAGPVTAQMAGEKTSLNSFIGVSRAAENFIEIGADSDLFDIHSRRLANLDNFKIQQFADDRAGPGRVALVVEDRGDVLASAMQIDNGERPPLNQAASLQNADLSGDAGAKALKAQYRREQARALRDAVRAWAGQSLAASEPVSWTTQGQ